MKTQLLEKHGCAEETSQECIGDQPSTHQHSTDQLHCIQVKAVQWYVSSRPFVTCTTAVCRCAYSQVAVYSDAQPSHCLIPTLFGYPLHGRRLHQRLSMLFAWPYKQAACRQASYLQEHKRKEHKSSRVVLVAAQESDLRLLGRSMVPDFHQSGLPSGGQAQHPRHTPA